MDYIRIVDGPASSDEGVTITATGNDADLLQRTILDAHRELADLPGPTAEQFRQLAERLKLEYDSMSR